MNERDAMRAMLEWIDDEAESVIHALGMASERCVEHAAEIGLYTPLGEVADQAAKSWKAKATKLAELYDALPDRELF